MKQLIAIIILTATVGAWASEGAIVVAPQPTNWTLLIITGLVPIIIAGIKLLIPKIPRAWLPVLAPVLGALVDLLLGGNWGPGTILAAIAGSAGVGLREIVDQIRKAAEQQRNEKS